MIALTFWTHIISGIDGVFCLKLYNKMHSYFSPSASGLLVVLKCTQPIDSGKKRLQVSIVIKATRQWMVLTPTMIRCKKSFLRLLPSFYVSIVPPAYTTTWSSILTVDAQWKILQKISSFSKVETRWPRKINSLTPNRHFSWLKTNAGPSQGLKIRRGMK